MSAESRQYYFDLEQWNHFCTMFMCHQASVIFDTESLIFIFSNASSLALGIAMPISHLVGPPFWCTLKFLHKNWMDCSEI